MQQVRLDGEQRDAIRSEIQIEATECGDVPLYLEDADRALVVRMIAKLERWVSVLDAIGWQEHADDPVERLVTVDPELAMWALGEAVELECALPELQVSHKHLDALSALRLIAQAGEDA